MKRSLLFTFLLALLVQPAFAQSAAENPRSTREKGQKTPSEKPAGNASSFVLGDIQLTQVSLSDAARMLSQVGKANVVVTGSIADKVVSLYLHNATVDDMVRNLCRAAGVWFRYDSTSKTYVIMSGTEYQKDLALVRDEQTQVFTLRHHNVVSTANAVKAVFGARVILAIPVEEMPPTSLGSGNRTSTGGSKSGTSGNGSGTGNNRGNQNGTNNGSAGNNSFGNNMGANTQNAGMQGGTGGGQTAANYDPTADLGRMSQDRLSSQMQLDANGQAAVRLSDVQDMAARQGPSIYVTYNKLNNLLIVRTGDESALKDIGQLVSSMDKPPKQVLLEMKILEVTLDDGYRSAFDIGTGSKGTTSGPGGWGNKLNESTNITAKNSLASGLFDLESDANLIWQMMSKSLSVRLQLLANENKLKVLSSPMLVAANNQVARLFIGDERVLTVGASSQSVTGTTGATNTTITVETEKRDVGQTLAILPRINGDRSVSLTVDQDSSTVKIGDATIPISTSSGTVVYFPIDTVNTANLQVTAHAKDGMTVAIGGMIKETVVRDDEKVPVLGDVPGLGFFFKRDVRAKTRTQIVLLITPRIIESPEEGDSIASGKTRDFNALTSTFPNNRTVPKLVNEQPSLQTPTPERSTESEANLAALARAAAKAALQTDPTKGTDNLRAIPLEGRTRLTLPNGMSAAIIGSWQRDDLYVTAMRVSNHKEKPDVLVATALPGRWAAIAIEHPELSAKFEQGDTTWLYAISRQPFEEALQLP